MLSPYDVWKTTPPENDEILGVCEQCIVGIYEGERHYADDIGAGLYICETCYDKLSDDERSDLIERY